MTTYDKNTLFGTPLSRRAVIAGATGAIAYGTFGPSAAFAAEGEPTLEIVSPAAGDVVTANDLEVTVKISDFTADCQKSGRPNEDGVGHMHVLLDGATMAQLINFYCDDTFTVPLDGLEAGTHTLIVDLATNTHQDMLETAQQVEFDYQPEDPQPLPEINYAGAPGIELTSPADGDTVPALFTIDLSSENFTANDRLEGKPNVPGYGHYHVFVDKSMDSTDMASPMVEMHATPEGEMATPHGDSGEGPLAGLVMMPGSDSFGLDLTAWGTGEHTIWIEPAQNDHTPYEDAGHVEFTVVVEE